MEKNIERTLGIIGGSGLYAMEGLEGLHDKHERTSFGEPSSPVSIGRLGTTKMLFLPRHGKGHAIAPHRVNYRANILALKQLGAEQIVSVSAVGSLRESIMPGDVVLVDQWIDRTQGRRNTFFDEDGVVAHVNLADPVDKALLEALYQAGKEAGVRIHRGGTYICIEGPQFSTRAESRLYRSWGADVVGMTNLPEARLAREAELPYASVALVTDFDCWRETDESVNLEDVLAVLRANIEKATAILRHVAEHLPDPALSPASRALRNAIVTEPSCISRQAIEKLGCLMKGILD